MANGYETICPACGNAVEVTKIRTREKSSFKYISFSKAVGVCPVCLSDIHVPEIDSVISQIQMINKDYSKVLSKYTNASDIPKDIDFSNDWDEISSNDLTFETDGSEGPLQFMAYNGTLKNEFGYDVVSLHPDYYNKYDEIIHKAGTDKTYNFKSYVLIKGELKQVCVMMWLNIENYVSGIIFNTDDTNSYRYGKQKAKDKYVIS